LCYLQVRGQDMVNVHPYTVQCVLPINLYNESIYVFLWYWMILVAVLSTFRSHIVNILDILLLIIVVVVSISIAKGFNVI